MRPTNAAIWLFVAVAALLSLTRSVPSFAQATPCADLAITGVDVSPAQPVAGAPATISIEVHNGGTCAAPGFVVQWRQDVFALTGPSKSVPSLRDGEGSTIVLSSTFTYPQPGNYLSVAQVDTGNAVSEFNEVNNLEIRSITVIAATRNLEITNFAIAPNPVVRGRTATASITIRNTGNSSTAPFRVEWSPFVFSSPISRQVAGLGPGESRVVTMDFTYLFDGLTLTSATVDTTAAVTETDENDNNHVMFLEIEPPLPELEVTGVDVSPFPVAGRETTVGVRVTNTGNDPAGPFRVQWQPWWLASPLSEQVNGLAVGATTTVTFVYTFPFAGTFDGTITVDSNSAVTELVENNNTRATSITAEVATIDLTVADLRLECGGSCGEGGNPVQGEAITAVVTVKNLGNSPSGSFVTEWNPDTFDIIPQGPHTVSEETGSLGPGQSREVRLLYTYPRAGNFRTIANVDAFNAVIESNETNNRRILNLVVDPAPIDLVIDSFTVPANPVRGVPTTTTIRVRNAGPIATGSFFVQWTPQPGALFPPSASVNGLNPGETRTLSLQATYGSTGTFTTTATVDVFDQVLEPFGEGNNTATRTVTVVPQQTTLDITLTEVRVFHDADDGTFEGGDGEWHQFFAVFDPAATCSFTILDIPITVPDFGCRYTLTDDVDAGETLRPNATIRVTLDESTPLLVAYYATEDDFGFGCILFSEDCFETRGYASLLSFRPDYLTLGTQVLPGVECKHNGGHCYDIVVRVSLVSTNAPALISAAAQTEPATSARQFRDSILGQAPSANDVEGRTHSEAPVEQPRPTVPQVPTPSGQRPAPPGR